MIRSETLRNRAITSGMLDNRDVHPARRRGGRPRGTPSTPATVRLPVPVYDAYCHEAQRRGVSLHAVLRDTLTASTPRQD